MPPAINHGLGQFSCYSVTLSLYYRNSYETSIAIVIRYHETVAIAKLSLIVSTIDIIHRHAPTHANTCPHTCTLTTMMVPTVTYDDDGNCAVVDCD